MQTPRTRVHRIWNVLRETAEAYQANHCPQMAAAIAYRALFSMIPGLALLVAAAGWMLRIPHVERHVAEWILGHVPIESGLVVESIRRIVRSSGSLTLVGVLALLWAALGLFGAMREGLDAAWGVNSKRGVVHATLVDVASIAGVWALVGISIAITVGLQTAYHAMSGWTGEEAQLRPLWRAIGWIVPASNTFVAFVLVYCYVPDVKHGIKDVWVGALAAAGMFELVKYAFAVYVAHISRYELLYGALGTVMLFMLWVFVSANILLLGAALMATWKRARDRDPAMPQPALQR